MLRQHHSRPGKGVIIQMSISDILVLDAQEEERMQRWGRVTLTAVRVQSPDMCIRSVGLSALPKAWQPVALAKARRDLCR